MQVYESSCNPRRRRIVHFMTLQHKREPYDDIKRLKQTEHTTEHTSCNAWSRPGMCSNRKAFFSWVSPLRIRQTQRTRYNCHSKLRWRKRPASTCMRIWQRQTLPKHTFQIRHQATLPARLRLKSHACKRARAARTSPQRRTHSNISNLSGERGGYRVKGGSTDDMKTIAARGDVPARATHPPQPQPDMR